jgi:hypothetical protein
MSNINEILVRIAEIQITVEAPGAPRPNVIKSEPYQPSNTSSTDCPFFINELHGGESQLPIASGMQYLTDQIWMVLCVRRAEARTNLKLSLQETVMWRDAVYAAFSNRVKLSDPAKDNTLGQAHAGLPFVLDCYIRSWEAISYTYVDTEYLSLKFILMVNEFYVTPIDK